MYIHTLSLTCIMTLASLICWLFDDWLNKRHPDQRTVSFSQADRSCLCRILYVTDAVSRSAASHQSQRVYIRLSSAGRAIDRAGERRADWLAGWAIDIIANSCYFSARLTICRVVRSAAFGLADQRTVRPRWTAPGIVEEEGDIVCVCVCVCDMQGVTATSAVWALRCW